MGLVKLLGAFVLCSALALAGMGAEEEALVATTEDGRCVILHPDGTWEWLSAPEEPLVSWREPTLDQFLRAAEWGAKQDGDPIRFWTLCESGPCQIAPDWEGSPLLFVGTPLAVAASAAYGSGQLGEDDLLELEDLLNKELSIGLSFRGTVADLGSSFDAVITQGDLVLRPFQSNLDYEAQFLDWEVQFRLECRFKIRDLDPERPFWISISQDMGTHQFLFKVDPDALGTGEFF